MVDGVQSDNLDYSIGLAEVIGNADVGGGTLQTARVKTPIYAAQLVQYMAQYLAGGGLAYPNYTTMNADHTRSNHQLASVFGDTGTHLDPITDTTVSNSGVFAYSTSVTGWQRLGDIEDPATIATLVASFDPRFLGLDNRVGVQVEKFTSAVEGKPDDTTALARLGVVGSAYGDVYQLSGAGIISPRDCWWLEPNRTYMLRAAYYRSSNPTDLDSQSVQVKVTWLDSAFNEISQTVAKDTNLTTSLGLQIFAARIPSITGDAVTLTPPSGAVYFRPNVVTHGTTGITNVVMVNVEDVTDAGAVVPDFTLLNSRVTTLENTDVTQNGRLSTLETNYGTLSGVVTGHTSTLSSYGTRITTLEGEVAAIGPGSSGLLHGGEIDGTIKVDTPVAIEQRLGIGAGTIGGTQADPWIVDRISSIAHQFVTEHTVGVSDTVRGFVWDYDDTTVGQELFTTYGNLRIIPRAGWGAGANVHILFGDNQHYAVGATNGAETYLYGAEGVTLYYGVGLIPGYHLDGSGNTTIYGDFTEPAPSVAAGGVAPYVQTSRERRAGQPRSIMEWIPSVQRTNIRLNTSTYDATANINSALGSGERIDLGVGTFKITDRLNASADGMSLRGASPSKTHFLMDSASFNMSAEAALSFSHNCDIGGFSFDCVQPSTTNRASMHQYPACMRGFLRGVIIPITGNGSQTVFTVTHNLATLYNYFGVATTGGTDVGSLLSSLTRPDGNTVQLTFTSPVPNGTTYNVTVIGAFAVTVNVSDIQFNRAWVGLDTQGNVYGDFHRLKFGCFGTGWVSDGALDFVRGSNMEFWGFGMDANQTTALFNNGGFTAMDHGFTAMSLTNIQGFYANFNFRSGGAGGEPDVAIGTIIADTGQISASAGRVAIGSVEGTRDGNSAWATSRKNEFLVTAGTDVPSTTAEAGHLSVGTCQLQGNSTPGGTLVLCQAGDLSIAGGFIRQFSPAALCGDVSGGIMALGSGLTLSGSTAGAPQSRSTVLVNQRSTGVLQMNAHADPGYGTNEIVHFNADNLGNFIEPKRYKGLNGGAPIGGTGGMTIGSYT